MTEANGDLNTNDGSQEEKGGENGGQPAWMGQLEDNLKTNETLTRFKTISDLGKSHLELAEKSKSYIKPLGEKPTPEELSEYRKAIGVPEKASDYKIERPEKLPEGMVYDEVLEKNFKEIAHKNNFTPKQVAELVQMHSNYAMNIHDEVLKSIAENRQKALDTLKNIWKGDTYKENTEKAVRSFYKFIDKSNPPEALGGKEGIKKWVEQNGIGDDPVMVWFFSKTFDLIGDDKFIKGTLPGGKPPDEWFPDMKK